MARVQGGDTDAFAELYDRHAVRALRVAQAICLDAGRAEDAVQEGFLSIWGCRAQFSPENGSFKAWSTRIIKSRVVELRGPPPPLELTETQGGKEGTMLVSLRELPAAQAEVIALAFFGELSHAEIAAMLDLPPGTVKGRMRLGLEKLRKRMGALA